MCVDHKAIIVAIFCNQTPYYSKEVFLFLINWFFKLRSPSFQHRDIRVFFISPFLFLNSTSYSQYEIIVAPIKATANSRIIEVRYIFFLSLSLSLQRLQFCKQNNRMRQFFSSQSSSSCIEANGEEENESSILRNSFNESRLIDLIE